MKIRISSFAFIIIFCTMVLTAAAQNSRFLLLEYIKIKTGNNDAYPLIETACERIQLQQQEDSSILGCSVWKVEPPYNNKQYQYIVATIFSDFSAYLEQYQNSDSKKLFLQVSDDSLKAVFAKKNEALEIIHAQVYEVLAEIGSATYSPKYMLCTGIKAAPGKRMAYESQEMQNWLPIHKDLIRKGFESAFNFSKLIFPYDITLPYDYSVFRFFDDETMFDRQNKIDWNSYIEKHQGAFINAGALRTEVHSELLTLVAFLESN